MAIIIYMLLALTIFLVLYGLIYYFTRGHYSIRSRLSSIQQISEIESIELDISVLTGSKTENTSWQTFPIIGPYYKRISNQIKQAHVPLKPSEFILISLMTSLVMFIIVFLLTGNIFVPLLPAFLGFILPRIFLISARDKRKKRLNEQLPEFLNVLSNALRAGLSFTQAISTASNEMPEPIQWELQKVLRDNNLGRPMDQALVDLSERTGDDDIEMFVSAINIQRQVGGNLSDILDMIAHTIRDRVKLKGEIRTMTAQNKLSAIIIGSLPIAIGFALSVLNPEYMSPLFTSFPGRFIVVIGLVLMIIAVFVLKKITTLEV